MLFAALTRTIKHYREGRSPQWPRVRREHLATNPSCAACGTSKGVEVHHVIPFSHDPSLELDPGNLLTLCEPRGCHLRIGHNFDWRAMNPHAVADAQQQMARIKSRVYPPKEDAAVIRVALILAACLLCVGEVAACDTPFPVLTYLHEHKPVRTLAAKSIKRVGDVLRAAVGRTNGRSSSDLGGQSRPRSDDRQRGADADRVMEIRDAQQRASALRGGVVAGAGHEADPRADQRQVARPVQGAVGRSSVFLGDVVGLRP
jgi:hypothetical protein